MEGSPASGPREGAGRGPRKGRGELLIGFLILWNSFSQQGRFLNLGAFLVEDR
mgnify:CR=1 FL=1